MVYRVPHAARKHICHSPVIHGLQRLGTSQHDPATGILHTLHYLFSVATWHAHLPKLPLQWCAHALQLSKAVKG